MIFEKPWGNYLLEKLVETPAPTSISFWPQTLAWQLIFTLLLLFGLKKTYQRWRRYQDNSYRREALSWLKKCSLTSEDDIRQLPALLRKTALLANKVSRQDEQRNQTSNTAQQRHHDINQLTGQAWAQWLNKHCADNHFNKAIISTSSAKLLAELAYIPVPTLKVNLNNDKFNDALTSLCQQVALWIEHHDLNATAQHDNSGVPQ